MKCQACDKAATYHVTDMVAGKPVEYHVCESHFQELESLKPALEANKGPTGALQAFWRDSGLREALGDLAAREKLAAMLLPPLCLGLLDEKPEVRIVAAFRLIQLGPHARSAVGALQDALRDPDERVRKAAAIAIEFIESEQELPWFY